jgi:uncharacterized protein YbjT (DUF2867 family)
MLCSTQIAKEHGGIMRFIQVSCLGASPSSESRMLRTKAAGEQSILKEFPEVVFFLFFSFSNAPGYDNYIFRTIQRPKPALNCIPFLSSEFNQNFVYIH